MLMRFSISNYLSFGYKENAEGKVVPSEFHLYAGNSQQFKDRVIKFDNRNLLKFSSLYGANASGKSNLIRAIGFGRDIVLKTMEQKNIKNKYCRNEESNRYRPTLFEYEFTIKDKAYAYGFNVVMQNQTVLSEWLYELNGSVEKVIFERSQVEQEYYFDENRFTNNNRQQFHFFMQDANRIEKSLLIYELERRKLDAEEFGIYHQIYEWFKKKLIIIYPEMPIGSSYSRFETNDEDLGKLLKYFDTGITGYHMQKIKESVFREYFSDPQMADHFLNKVNSDKEVIKGILKFGNSLFELERGDTETSISKLEFVHGDTDIYYEYGEESDGTQRLIELLDVIMNDEEEKVFLIDELDRSLHPQMTRKFVESFLEFSKGKTTQLIITTHESNLMDLEILRRDEIWFAEKEKDNTTTLYTLEKFKVRYDKVVSKDYLAGRYGAVPVFKDFAYVWGRNGECSD